MRLGFNIAAKLACDTRFMRGFLERLAASGQARRFTLEITEEAFLPSGQFQARVLPMIREIGAHLSIDDFGAGYSSLATLADITADEVKVDRSLIIDIDKRPRSQSLLKAIESIGVALATEVIVEGVETEAEFVYLRDHTHIRVAQGYYFGKPLMLSGVAGGVAERAQAKAGRAHAAFFAPAHGARAERPTYAACAFLRSAGDGPAPFTCTIDCKASNQNGAPNSAANAVTSQPETGKKKTARAAR